MIARTWTVDVAPADFATYETFARDVSLAMFKRQEGFRGVLMTRDETTCQVVSLWSDSGAVAALETSPSYRETVAAIEALGILTNPRPVQISEVHALDVVASIGVDVG